jgi:hypothetical protein
MWLKFGVSCDNALVCIEDIPSGKTLSPVYIAAAD